MEKFLLGIFYLSGWLILCQCRQYHFFNKSLTWDETHLYCRTQNYTELAHAEDTKEMNQLKNTVLAAGYNSKVWINLYTHINYKSANYYSEDYFSRENQKDETAPFFVRFFCGSVSLNGLWWNNNCSVERPFICYNGTNLSPVYVLVNESMDWFSALRYCRENFTELTRTWNSYVQMLVPNGTQAWIGRTGQSHNHWSPGFGYWDDFPQTFDSEEQLCGVADLQRSGKWRLLPCETKLPFVCYTYLQNNDVKEKVHQRVMKLRVKMESSSVNAVKADLLKKMQNKLKEEGVSGVTLKWRQQPDGEVFHKGEESSEKEEKKKTEL